MSQNNKTSRSDEMNNLNVSLHSIISDEKLDDVPFVDEDDSPLPGHKFKNDKSISNESISSSDSYVQEETFKKSLATRKRVNLKLVINNSEETSDNDELNLESEKRDKPGPLISDVLKSVSDAPSIGLRRNSFSLPALNEVDLDTLRSLHMKAVNDEDDDEIIEVETPSKSTESFSEIHVLDDEASMACSIEKESEENEKNARKSDESESDTELPLVSRSKFRTRRRASIAPLPSIRLNDKEIMVNSEYDAQSVISAAPSITSVSSLASLLKEKMQALPSMIRKRKKPKDYKIRIFVAILFFMIIFLVGYAYIMYNHKITSKMYFEHIKFNSGKRLLHVSDANGTNVLSGNLATQIGIQKAYSCRSIINDEKKYVCWEWANVAKLHISLDKNFQGSNTIPSSRCYNFMWESLSENFNPIDCFNIGHDRGQWYGAGVTKEAEWLLEKVSFNFTPFITGDVRFSLWGNAIKRYFINSLGIAIEIDQSSPFHLSVNSMNNSQMCFMAAYDDFAFVSRPTSLPVLKYRICTANDMKVLHHNLTQKNLWDGLKENEINLVKAKINEPIWEISDKNLTDVTISNFTDDIIGLNYFRLGHVLVSEQWQKHVGDFEVDEENFNSLADIIDVLHRRGFKISLTIQPFISTESKTFAELVEKKLLIYERLTERTIPALTKFKSSRSDGVLDPTNNDTIPWLLKKLESVKKKYKIDSFYLEFGTALDMPKFYECHQPILNPDEYKTIFMNNIKNSGISVLGVSSTSDVPSPPAFLSVPQVNSTWHGIKTVLSSVINYSIIGYPFLMLGAIGGDFFVEESATVKVDSMILPEKELYIRWLQLATFLPVMRFKYLPSYYKDESLTEIAKELALIRQKTVNAIFDKFVNIAMDEGLPLVRPLWMLDPHDAACVSVVDEFSVGDQIIVAPILEKGLTIREVYLPTGVWKDGIDGSLRKGSRWIHNYRVLENQIAFFVKMPDNTRF